MYADANAPPRPRVTPPVPRLRGADDDVVDAEYSRRGTVTAGRCRVTEETPGFEEKL